MEVSGPRICVVLPAAGTGERMGLDTPKQYLPILHKPLIFYTLSQFLRIHWIKKIVVVAAPANFNLMTEILNLLSSEHRERIEVTSGGENRHESIYMGLKCLQCSDDAQCDLVIIHDGVRPFVDEDVLYKVTCAAEQYGAAGVMCPLVSTVIAVSETDFLDHSLDRNKFKASEMPQAFRYEVILDAYSKCSEQDMKFGTECLHLVQKYMNVNAKLIKGTSLCWKVTYKRDIYTARGLIKESETVGIVGGSEDISLCNVLKESLLKKFKKVDSLELIHDDCRANFVVIHPQKSILDVIELEQTDQGFCSRFCHVTVVNVTFDGNRERDIQSLQRRAKDVSRRKKGKHIISQYVITKWDLSPELLKETADMITSLLLESNEHLSGQIFLM